MSPSACRGRQGSRWCTGHSGLRAGPPHLRQKAGLLSLPWPFGSSGGGPRVSAGRGLASRISLF